MASRRSPHESVASAEPQLHQVDLINVLGMEGTLNRLKRKVKKAILIAVASGGVGALAAHEAQQYTRGVTGYQQDVFQQMKKERETPPEERVAQEGMLSKAYQWIKGTESIESIAEASATYKEIRYQYYSILALLDDTSYWGAFIMTFYAMARMLQKIDTLRRKGKEGIDPDMKINQDHLAATINAIGRQVYALEQKTVSKEDMQHMMEHIKEVQESIKALEDKQE